MRKFNRTIVLVTRGLRNYFFTPRFFINRLQLNLFVVLLLGIGMTIGIYMTLLDIIPKIFATAESSITKDTDTDFNQGTLTTATVSGTLTAAYLQIATGGGPGTTTYRRSITVNNSSNSNALTNYQVYITLDTASLITAGKLQSNCADLRFNDNDDSTALSYWVENCNSATSKIWVKIPSISASTSKTIYLYYGNSAASAQSSTTNTFVRVISNVAAAWEMEDCTGSTATDSAVLQNHSSGVVTINSGGTQTTTGSCSTTNTAAAWYNGATGKYGSALNFDGTDDYVNLGIPSVFPTGASARTVCLWAKPATVTGGYKWAFAYGTASNNQSFFIGRNNADLDVGGYGGGNDVTSSNFWSAGTWAHVCNVFDGTKAYAYGNGAILNSGGTAKSWSVVPNVSYIARQTNGGEYWNGMVDHVHLYNTALTAAEVADEATATRSGYVTPNFANNELIREYSSPEPSTSVGTEGNAYYASGTYVSPTDSNVIDLSWNGGWGTGAIDSTAFSAVIASMSAAATVKFEMRVAASVGGLASATYKTIGTATSGTAFTATKADLDALPLATGSARYVQVKTTLSQTDATTPRLNSFTINYVSDNTAPESNASSIAMLNQSGGSSVSSNGWTNKSSPYFSWTAASDSQSDIQGYCLYLNRGSSGDPIADNGILKASASPATPLHMTSACPFFTTSTSINLTSTYQGDTWLSSGDAAYYLNIKAVDNSGNYVASSASFHFRFDNTAPTNVAYILPASGNFSNVSEMNFSWPSGTTDSNSGVLGWQYQLNSTSGSWQGTTHSSALDLDYIPATASAYTFISSRDSSSVVSGSNTIYFRAVDTIGNVATTDVRSGVISFGGAAPSFSGSDVVTVTPSTATSNAFALSWPIASPSGSFTVTHYYYMLNTSPPATLATLQGNAATYIDNGTSRTVATDALPNVNKGSNTVYVVAIDNASTPNYSPSNYISGTFTLDSTDPDNPDNLVVSDSSIKAQSQWNVTLSWTAPSYKGAGNLTYLIYRSTDGSSFSQVGTTTGLSYVDNVASSREYYYKLYAQDGANATSSGTNAVTITPSGKWTTAPSLDSGPTASSISTKKATITWSTSRTADSKVAFGIKSGSYNDEEPSNSSQVTSHTINLTSLVPGTTYYYKVKWTDEDGNTAESKEYSFTTLPPPSVSAVKTSNISLYTGYINFTVTNAAKVTINYGKTTAYGNTKIVTTSTDTSTYSVKLEGLSDGTSYHYQLSLADSEGNIFTSDDYTDLVTLPAPKISNIRVQGIKNTAQTAILVSWITNTDVSSIVSYYPESSPQSARDLVDLKLVKGAHSMIVGGLQESTVYALVVKGRDKVGNEVVSDIQTITTALDSRSPEILNIKIDSAVSPILKNGTNQTQSTQLVISWDTDELATSQVQFSQGAGTSYTDKTQEDSALTYNHIIVIPNLPASTVYHLQILSKDKVGNLSTSEDNVTITSKSNPNAFNLVISNLVDAFGFLNNIGQ